MSNIKNWSRSPNNNTNAPPNGAPEGWSGDDINAVVRQQMTDHRTQWEDAQWFNHGHVPIRQSDRSFLVSGTVTEVYSPGRRLRIYDTTTIYGEVLASTATGVNTLVSLSCSSLSSSLSSVDVAILETASPIRPATKANQKAASISSTNLTNYPITVEVYKNHPAMPRAMAAYISRETSGSGFSIGSTTWNILSVTATVVTGPITVTFAKSLTSSNYTVILGGTKFVTVYGQPQLIERQKGLFRFSMIDVSTGSASITFTTVSSFSFAVYGSDYKE